MYVKPTFVKQMIGVMNKFGNAYYRSFCDNIDGVTIEQLVKKFGSPLFVFSMRKLREQYQEMYQIFSTRYPNVQCAWSYKTNYLDAICATLHHEGAIAEVVSGFEYEKATRLGINGSSIIFNGPCKSAEELKRAFTNGSIVNIDNFDELYCAERVAQELGKKVSVGIRVNMDNGIYPQWFKFGFNLDNRQAMEAVNRIARSAHLRLNGLHAHIGTFVLDPNAYAIETEKMVKFMQEIEDNSDFTIEYIDVGGGFPSQNRLKGIYLPPEVAIPSMEEYAEAICNTLLRYLRPNEYPKLYLEAGRSIVDEAGYLISTVNAQKYLPDGRKSYFIDAGINLMYTATWYNFNLQPDRQLSSAPERCTVFGPLCMNIDVIADSIYLPPLPVKSRLVIHPVGAYNLTQWMQFITYRPAVVMIMDDKSVEIIRRAEKLDDVLSCEKLPEKLKIGKK